MLAFLPRSVGPQTCVLMDEISTGLDSATAYAVVKTFRDVAHGLERTFVISLLQPAPEVSSPGRHTPNLWGRADCYLLVFVIFF